MSGKARDEAWVLPRKRDGFGLRTGRVHSPQLMRDIADRLERLQGDRESEAARGYVEEVLRCPYWGLRVLAIRVLAAWGGRHNKRWLMERAGRRTSHEHYPKDRLTRWHDLETMTARLALRPLLTTEDAGWLLDAFFADAGWNFWHLAATMVFISDHALCSRLEADMVSQDVDRRVAVLRMVAQRRNLPAGPDLMRFYLLERGSAKEGPMDWLGGHMLGRFARREDPIQARAPAIRPQLPATPGPGHPAR